ncbi:hypothetical protein E2C01_022495 [Portunus trituberculatus]|uniref:Uncharacterized protein n=1 Tax=Portunus trituberculatus TaxID=210409 RepID=A0A5B7E5J4_PORTR|nr:hypothetical protein [Portunus trituberculatus]
MGVARGFNGGVVKGVVWRPVTGRRQCLRVGSVTQLACQCVGISRNARGVIRGFLRSRQVTELYEITWGVV